MIGHRVRASQLPLLGPSPTVQAFDDFCAAQMRRVRTQVGHQAALATLHLRQAREGAMVMETRGRSQASMMLPREYRETQERDE